MLEHDDLAFEIAAHHTARPLVVEITEHQPVEDYVALSASLDRLRELGVRVAVDDVGSGFASFRHVTRVNPDILKLDRTLVCGIDDDPVRQSLASAIVAFAADVGAVVVSEGIESESELCCLKGLAVGCGQGFYLARPGLGQVDAEMPELAERRLEPRPAGAPASSGLRGQPGRRLREVERRGRHVVRRVGVEERREQLDLPARGPELAHPAAVHQQALGVAVRVDLEQRPQRRRSATA